VRPSLIVEVEYRQRLKDGLRHAALKGLRPDKKPGLIRRSQISERGPFFEGKLTPCPPARVQRPGDANDWRARTVDQGPNRHDCGSYPNMPESDSSFSKRGPLTPNEPLPHQPRAAPPEGSRFVIQSVRGESSATVAYLRIRGQRWRTRSTHSQGLVREGGLRRPDLSRTAGVRSINSRCAKRSMSSGKCSTAARTVPSQAPREWPSLVDLSSREQRLPVHEVPPRLNWAGRLPFAPTDP